MDTDVLIAGGGLSGLSLADHLSQRGVDYLLVESQDRFGGRILTKEVAGGQFDLGPAWFWPGQPRIMSLAQRFDIPVFEQFSDGDLMFQDRTGAVQRGRGYASMQGSYRLAGGMVSLIDALAGAQVSERLMLGAKLRKIEHASDAITAHFIRDGEKQTIKARHVVLALPPRVAAEAIAFEPSLDDVALQSLRSIPTWMAGQAKIVAVYDKPHWRDAGLSGDAMSHRGPMVEIHDASPMLGAPYALFGFVGVPAEVRAGQMDQLLQAALVQLQALFGPHMSAPRELILQDWATVPETSVAQDRVPMSHHPAYGLPTDLKALSQRRIHFGVTETADAFGGFLEGALEAAERTADHLVRSLIEQA